MRYMMSVLNDESVPLPTGADWDASLARVTVVNEEMQEQVGEFWGIEVADLDEALSWAQKCAEACWGPIEVRPLDDLSQH